MTVLLAFAAGCGPSAMSRQAFDGDFRAARYDLAANSMGGPALCAGPPDSKRLLETLETGAAYRALGRRGESCKLFDDAETYLKEFDQQSLAETSAQVLAQLAVNDNVRPYRGQTYDGVMVNVYKALNYLEDAKWAQARVELNRASERQRRAVERFSASIKKQQEAIARQNQQSQGFNIDKTLADPELKSTIDEKYKDLSKATSQWSAYPDFVNPFASYAQGLGFFLMAEDQADYNKARDAMKRVYGMTGNSTLVQGDIAMIDSILDHRSTRKSTPATVWVLFENGLGPVKEEIRVNVPIYSEKVSYVGIALPTLRFREPAYQQLRLRSGSNDVATTEDLFSIDGVVAKEFQLQLPQVISRAVVSAVLKAAMQAGATEAAGGAGQIFAGMYSALTTGTDTRMWTALPKSIQLARFPRPESGHLDIVTPLDPSPVAHIDLPKSHYSVVFVKIPAPGARATYTTIASAD